MLQFAPQFDVYRGFTEIRKAATFFISRMNWGFCVCVLCVSGDHVTFVYPDMRTVLTGRFEKSVLVQAKPARITAERCWRGVKQIQISNPTHVSVFFLDKYFCFYPNKDPRYNGGSTLVSR